MASAAIVTIGNELLSGDVENTNGSWLARRLEAAGVDVRLIAVVPDESEEIATTLREQADRAQIVGILTQALEIHPRVRVGSYPSFGANGPYVEVVLKSNDPDALEAAAAWLTQALEQRLG